MVNSVKAPSSLSTAIVPPRPSPSSGSLLGGSGSADGPGLLQLQRLAHGDGRNQRRADPEQSERVQSAGEIAGQVAQITDDRRRHAAAEDTDRIDPGDT